MKISLPQFIATGFGAGYWPYGPGTAGALLATLMWLGLSIVLPLGVLWWVTLALIALFALLGIWATNQVIPQWGDDPQRVVIDEMVGTWIALLGAPSGQIGWAFLAFALFRFFDILKPLGIRQMERLPRGTGVMMDDVLAGVYSMGVMVLIRVLCGSF